MTLPFKGFGITMLLFFVLVYFYFFKEMYAFVWQGCITLIKNDSVYIYNVTKDFYFK